MPAASSFSLLASDSSDEWKSVGPSSKGKHRTSTTQPSPASSQPSNDKRSVPISLVQTTKGARVSSGGTAPGSAVSSRLYQGSAAPPASASRLATHDDTGKPLAEDYYRAFQRCFKDAAGDVILRFHRTDIVKVKPNGEVQLATGKYYTFTTMCSINDALQFIDMKLQVTGDVKDPANWIVTSSSASSIKYEENMVIKPRGPQDRERGMEILTGMRALLESTSQAHAEKLRTSGDQAKRAPIMLTSAKSNTTTADTSPAAPAEPPIVVPLPTSPPAPLQLVAGSAWAAKGSLAAKLAAETAARKPAAAGNGSGGTESADFPALSSSAPSNPTPLAAAAAADANKPAARQPPAATSRTTAPAQPTQAAATPPPQHATPAAAAPANTTRTPPPGFAAPTPTPAPIPPAFEHPPAAYGGPPPGMPHPTRPAYPAAPPGFHHPGPYPHHGLMEVSAEDLHTQLPDSLDELYAGGHTTQLSPRGATTSSAAPPAPPAADFTNADQLAAVPTSQAIKAVLSQSRQWDGAGDDTTLCVVCMHHKCDTILIPCSHAILCKGCADMVINLTPGSAGECPVCRSPVDLVLDVM